jgi:hypothetical protein
VPTSKNTGWLFATGITLIFFALVLQTVTLASGQYASVLLSALALTIIADLCFVAAFKRGSLTARCLSVALMLPTLFIVADFLRRAPHSFWQASSPSGALNSVAMNTSEKGLAERCAAYLRTGPPAHMKDYVPDSLTEIIIAHGARSEPLNPELRELGGLIIQEPNDFTEIEDGTIRSYMQDGAALVVEVLRTQK